jgi:hypothetical protein
VKLTIEDDNNRTVIIDDPDVTDIQSFHQLCMDAALALGYHPDTVKSYFDPEEE